VLALSFAFPVVFGIVAAFTLGPIPGILTVIPAFALPGAVSRYLPAQPKLTAAFALAGSHSIEIEFGQRKIRPIPKAAFIDRERNAARATFPAIPPKDEVQRYGGMRVVLPQAAFDPMPTLEEKTEFAQEIEGYVEALGDWFDDYELARARKSRQFTVAFRVENDGEAPAENVRLRIRLPDDFEEVATRPEVGSPPTRPVYVPPGPGGIRVRQPGSIDLSLLRSQLAPQRRGNSSRPLAVCSLDGGNLLLTYNLGTLNHGPDHLRTHPCEIRVPGPGSYEGRWEVLAANGVSRGPLRIIVPPALDDTPFATLEELSEERESLGLAA
jgi:hypothetical protein